MLKKVECSSKKMVLKFDIEMTCKLGKLQDLTKAIANILGLRQSALRVDVWSQLCRLIPSQPRVQWKTRIIGSSKRMHKIKCSYCIHLTIDYAQN